MRENGTDFPLFTSDGESRYNLSVRSLEDKYKTVNFSSYPKNGFNDLKEYLPGVWLKERNEIVVFELEGCKDKSIIITDRP